ncbi:MAG: uroporphyrinogen decarboxylase [Eubacteriaceae bacterium]|nr:uroporphyrinogen decarboxylase [Eubacteriaceae bacterium]
MLTKRENFLETIRGGNPDRFVNQFEALGMIGAPNPQGLKYPRPTPGGEPTKTGWGVTYVWPEGMPGGMPDHVNEENIVLKDITKWRDYVKMPEINFPDEAWADFAAAAAAIDRNEVFCTLMVAPGLFEMCHHLQSMGVALENFYLEPDSVKELIAYFTEYELLWAEQLLKYSKADLMLHHDDWGAQKSTFFSPAMFKEFFVEPYKEIYGFYKDNGVEIIVHHADSYAANLVPDMIDIGIDVFQGCLSSNNVPELIKEFGGQISFMGDLNNGVLDVPNWSPEVIRQEVERACRTNGKLYYIPCLTAGGPGSSYPGVFDAVTAEINRMSEIMF